MRILLCMALAAPLAAQPGTAPTAAKDSTGSLVDRAARWYRSASSVRAEFEQTLTSPATGVVQVARGEYLQGGGSRFTLRFTEPAGDAIVNDGTSLWLYLPSSTKGQVIKIPGQAGAGFDLLAQLLAAPRADYSTLRVRDETVDGHRTAVFSLTPRKPGLPFTSATLWIDRADARIWQLETVEASGLVRRVHFLSMEAGVALPAGAFVFAVPPGVKIIDQSALFGARPR